MSTRLGHTRYRVWITPLEGFFEVHWRERAKAPVESLWSNRKVERGLTYSKATALRKTWINEALKLHAEEHGLDAPGRLDQSVKKGKGRKVKPPRQEGGLF